ncbi:MAG: hypothetical protein NC348_09930 [Clostridium sp.]|nr:hypothetical protein [Clostridium sp.]
MKTKYKQIIWFCMVMFFCLAYAPGVKAEEAAEPVTKPDKPVNLGLYASDVVKESEDLYGYILTWDKDTDLYANYINNDVHFGYDIRITTFNNKRIKKMDVSINNDLGELENNKFGVYVQNLKFASQGFKFKIRSYVYDENNNKIYSKFSSEKVIIPRASILRMRMAEKNVKVTWEKITGAASYSIFLSSDGGKTFKKTATTKTRTCTLKNLKKKKNYYIYVQANKVKYKNAKYNSTKPDCSDKTLGVESFRIDTKPAY